MSAIDRELSGTAPALVRRLSCATTWLLLGLGPGIAMAGGAAALDTTDGLLKPSVKVERRGRLLVLMYQAVDAQGTPSSKAQQRGVPPRCAIYKGQREIASGQFAYG